MHTSYALGIEYRDPKYWWIGTNILFWQKPIDVSPYFQNQQFYKNPASGFPFPEATEERQQNC
jgi:hypothetical protein